MRIEEYSDAQGSPLSRYWQRLLSSEYPDARESPLSVARKWLPWSIGLIFALTLGWTALIAWDEVSSGKHTDILETAIAVGSKTAPAAPLIVIYSIMVTSVSDTLGGYALVTARYLGNKFVKPVIEKHRAEGRDEGRDEERRMWTDWNTRRLEAEKSGQPFDEPPPAS